MEAYTPEITYVNKGIGGNTTAQMLARFNTDAIGNTSPGDGIIIQGGINNILSTADTAQDILDDIDAMIALSLTNDRVPIVMMILPWKGYSGWDAGKQTITDDVNTGIIAREVTNVVLVVTDQYDRMEDATNADYMITGYDKDGLHPTYSGDHAVSRINLDTIKPAWEDDLILQDFTDGWTERDANNKITFTADQVVAAAGYQVGTAANGMLKTLSGSMPTNWALQCKVIPKYSGAEHQIGVAVADQSGTWIEDRDSGMDNVMVYYYDGSWYLQHTNGNLFIRDIWADVGAIAAGGRMIDILVTGTIATFVVYQGSDRDAKGAIIHAFEAAPLDGTPNYTHVMAIQDIGISQANAEVTTEDLATNIGL
jgi:hypothetical protein